MTDGECLRMGTVGVWCIVALLALLAIPHLRYLYHGYFCPWCASVRKAGRNDDGRPL